MSSAVDEPESLGFQRFDCTTDQPALLAAATEAAREAIEAGECIVLPTDTVYGIGADAFSPDAVQRLLDAKGRGRDMPPPVLIGEPTLIRALAVDVPEEAKELIERHWPGPLTIICRMQPSLRMDLGDNENTIALRVPDHELAREVLRRTGPMAVSSANHSGQPAALTCDEADRPARGRGLGLPRRGRAGRERRGALDHRRLHPQRRRRDPAGRGAQRRGDRGDAAERGRPDRSAGGVATSRTSRTSRRDVGGPG